jgi:hypothetical protein
MRRALGLAALALGCLLAGCGAPSAVAGLDDPSRDRLGWEDGYWYNDTVSVSPEDGLNATERDRVIARAMARVERLRGLEFESSVDVSVIGREELSAGVGGEPNEALRAFDNAKFEALFVVGGEEDAVSTQTETRNRTVAGFYSPSRGNIVVVSDAASPEFDGERTLAHELVHALQDQQFDLSRTAPSARTRDAVNGRNGLVEGDARSVELAYVDRCGAEWRCLPGAEPAGDTGNGNANGNETEPPINLGLYILSYFPYSDGPGFVSHLRERANGSWDAVDAAFGDPPTSSAVVIDPERYREFEPRSVALDDRAAGGWERVRPPGRPDYATLGQSALTAMFAYTLYDDYNASSVVSPDAFLNLDGVAVDTRDPFNYSIAPVRGWTGDRLHVYRRGDETGYVWRLTWASPDAAERFADRYRELLDHWGGSPDDGIWRLTADSPFAGAVDVRVDGDAVTVVGGPDRAALGELRGGGS